MGLLRYPSGRVAAGTSRRFCKNGFDLSVSQVSGTCLWQSIAQSELVRGIYTGDCGKVEDGSDGFFYSVPAANHQYRVTINRHPCSQNLPNQHVFNSFKVTSDPSQPDLRQADPGSIPAPL